MVAHASSPQQLGQNSHMKESLIEKNTPVLNGYIVIVVFQQEADRCQYKELGVNWWISLSLFFQRVQYEETETVHHPQRMLRCSLWPFGVDWSTSLIFSTGMYEESSPMFVRFHYGLVLGD